MKTQSDPAAVTDCPLLPAGAKWASAPNDIIPQYERYYQRVLEAGSASAASI